MKIQHLLTVIAFTIVIVAACTKPSETKDGTDANATSVLKIAYVNGDTILHKYDEFRKQSEVMDEKQRRAEDQLQAKGAALEKEIMAYQKKAQGGTMTPKEMEAHEKYLASRQQAVMAERDQMAKEILAETDEINKHLQQILHAKLDEVKEKEGYDFILNAAEGGSVLAVNEKYNITEQVLKMLNEDKQSTLAADTLKKK